MYLRRSSACTHPGQSQRYSRSPRKRLARSLFPCSRLSVHDPDARCAPTEPSHRRGRRRLPATTPRRETPPPSLVAASSSSITAAAGDGAGSRAAGGICGSDEQS
uniref:Uncharacterized protein n=1 Tax=Arundo donax TaxID=35708 RepID=A0A0A9F6H3_ARUDO